MLKPATEQMPVDFAKALLKLRAEGDILDRIEYLRPRANHGELTEDEQNEYREIVEAIDIIAVLQKSNESSRGVGFIPFHIEHIIAQQHRQDWTIWKTLH